ncbi:lytic transglycosylase domain-containing protein [Acetobacter sicerae]|uniref:lytic transglycosylase domain-containing protein n=1 Tax=Acetobacter sicerae TaxID=85325 RepID=UPI00156A8AB4|nr:lytic transglycosylase domain-containing protein [Acetobacter sicerae]NHN93161.1 transglycosylase SLT domain-containing protein [Acetobacter sicerae]
MSPRIALAVVAALSFFSVSPAAYAQSAEENGRQIAACLNASAKNAGVPRGVLLVLLYVEDGHPGMVSPNSNGTADLGPMQVNTAWVDRIARRWHSTHERAYAALRDSSCANIEAGAWILGQAMQETRGDLWQAVAFYHSHTPRYGEAYLRRFYDITQRLMIRIRKGERS